MNTDEKNCLVTPSDKAIDAGCEYETIPGGETFELGQWYWVKTKKGDRLACVMETGSNFVELRRPILTGKGHRVHRVHYTQYHEILRRELQPGNVIAGFVAHFQEKVSAGMAQVKAITAQLGVSTMPAINAASQEHGNSLCVMAEASDIKQYEKALIKAKDIDLPSLFKQIKTDSEALAVWLSAEAMPLEAMAAQLEGSIGTIKDRIFNITLYAGLTEEACLVREGEPAAYAEKLRVMQRRLYMDEECLAGYRVGGIEFSTIEQFDEWLSEDDNFQRVLPFPRCLVAFKVRRREKHRESDGSLRCALLNLMLSELDEKTVLFVRNGDRLYRLTTEIDFGEMIFPDSSIFDPNEPLMFNHEFRSKFSFMSVREWESRKEEEIGRRCNHEKWEKANPDARWFDNPFGDRFRHFSFDAWKPLNEGDVYFDEAMASINQQIKQYNRIALVIQGLFDRSDVLHPHPPVKSWTPEGFSSAIELMYDGQNTLHHGEAPDIEAYIAECNAKITAGSVLYGQDRVWQRKEIDKERARNRGSAEHIFSSFRPYGNDGPGLLAVPAEWKPKSRVATFAWLRMRLKDPVHRWDNDGPIRTSISVPASELFNVSAYTPGDFKRFYQDARTRQNYLKWGPMFMLAEEYHAGNVAPSMPVPVGDKGA